MLRMAFFAVLLSVVPANAAPNILFVMDSSNSMWGQVDGVPKIETAKAALGQIVSDLPADAAVGLLVYGHRFKDDCDDVELVMPITVGAAAEVVEKLASLTPKGKTPIAGSLDQSATAFSGLEGSKSVVLISDGVETCDGDPCGAAERLAAAGVDVRVHVVGFDLTPEERAELDCIAEKGKGRYFSADSIEGFKEAVSEAVEAAQEPVEEVIDVAQADSGTETDATPEIKRTSVWVEEFNDLDLPEAWTVENPNPDNYLVEDGNLVMLASENNQHDNPDAQNLMIRTEPLPRGDWDIEVSFSGEFRTGADRFNIGLRKDAENFLTAELFRYIRNDRYCQSLNLTIEKRSRGQATVSGIAAFEGCAGDIKPEHDAMIDALFDRGGMITLSKRGRSYFAAFSINGYEDENGNPIVWKTDRLTSLRTPGDLTISVSKKEDEGQSEMPGETLVFIDKIEAFAVEGAR